MGKGRRRRRRQNQNQKKKNQDFLFMGSNKSRKKEKKQKKEQKPSIAYTGTSKSSSYGSSYGSSYSTTTTVAKQPVTNPDNVIRTDRGCFEFIHSRAWGTVLVPVTDPSAHKVTLDEINGIKLIENFPKIPKELWARWISLCFYFCPDKPKYSSSYTPTIHKTWDNKTRKWEYYKYVNGNRQVCTEAEWKAGQNKSTSTSSSSSCGSHSGDLEVSMLLCRKADDLDQWRILIPKQIVSGGSVNADLSETIDIVTGERFDAFPPVGWVHAGSSHSHNTMAAFFSGTDDKSELTVPGLHIVVGRIDKKKMTYEHKASVVLRQLRKKVDLFDVVDAEPVEEVTFHADVLEYISKRSYTVTPSRHWSGWDDEDDDYYGFGYGYGYRTGGTSKKDDEPANPNYVEWKKKQEAAKQEKKKGGPRGKTMGFHGPDDPGDSQEENVGSDTAILPVPVGASVSEHKKQTLEELENSLETAIAHGEQLDLREIAQYYEQVNLPFDPEEWR